MIGRIAILGIPYLMKHFGFFAGLFATALIVLGIFGATSGPAWAQRKGAAKDPVPTTVVLKRGSIFPLLQGDLVATDRRVSIENEKRELRAFSFQLRGCKQKNSEIDCQAGSGSSVQIPVLYFVTDDRRPTLRGIELQPPYDTDKKKLELSEYLDAGIEYDSSQKSQQFSARSGRLQWISIAAGSEISPSMRLALQICDGPAAACSDPSRFINLADFYAGSQPAVAGAAVGIPPTKPIAGAASTAGSLRDSVLPGVTNETTPRTSAAQRKSTVTSAPLPTISDAASTAAGSPSKNTLSPDVTINLSIRGIPREYDAQMVAQLILSSLSTNPSSGADVRANVLVLKVNDSSSESRSGTLVLKRALISALRIADRPVECEAATCNADILLREWVLLLNALPEKEATGVHAVPSVQLGGFANFSQFYKQLNIDSKYLPPLRKPGVQQPHMRVHLPDNSLFQVQFRNYNDKNPLTIYIPSDRSFGTLSLVNVSDSQWRLDPSAATSTPTLASNPTPQAGPPRAAPPAPAAPSRRAHLVLQALTQQPGWPVERANQRLLRLLQASTPEAFRPSLNTNGGQTVASDEPKAEVSQEGVVVWSGEPPQSEYTWKFNGLPAGLPDPKPSAFGPVTRPDKRIHPTEMVARAVVPIPMNLLYDRWNINVAATNRIYGRQTSIEANELCDFHLMAQSNDATTSDFDAVLKMSSQAGTRVLRTANPVESIRLLGEDTKFQLNIRGRDGAARCASGKTDLPPISQWSIGEDSSGGTLTVNVLVNPRGRWLLGLYAPQDLGLVEGDSRSIADAQIEIFKRVTTSLDEWRSRHFSTVDPARSALGFDLALLSGVDATISGATPFAEANIITGKYRQSPTQQFQLDGDGIQRFNEFMSGPKSAGGAPSFDALGRSVQRYSALFSNLSDDRAPIVFYVGANKPLPNSCSEWMRATQSISALPGKPRALAVVFANSSASDIARDLGKETQTRTENFNSLSRGYSCEGANRSLLVFVPFTDLVAQRPKLVLDGVFRTLDDRLAEIERN